MSAQPGDALCAAYVLHLRPWRETSLIIECLTAERGRIALIGRGLRRPRRGAPAVQPFSRVQVAWRGRGELLTATTFELERFHRLTGDALYAGLYLNELMMRLLQRDDPHPEVFDVYADVLDRLEAGAALEPVLRHFELCLLDALGYGFALDADVTGAPLQGQARYGVDPEAGLVPIGLRDGDAAGFALELPGHVLEQVARGQLQVPAVAQAAKRMTRLLLAPHLGPRPLRSRALFAGRRGDAAADA